MFTQSEALHAAEGLQSLKDLVRSEFAVEARACDQYFRCCVEVRCRGKRERIRKRTAQACLIARSEDVPADVYQED